MNFEIIIEIQYMSSDEEVISLVLYDIQLILLETNLRSDMKILGLLKPPNIYKIIPGAYETAPKNAENPKQWFMIPQKRLPAIGSYFVQFRVEFYQDWKLKVG